MGINADRTEVLAIRGRIDEVGLFTPGRCISTFFVRRWPTRESTGYVIELLATDDRPVHREPALVELDETCDPMENRRWRLTAYIGLREGAVAVQLRRDELVLWRRGLPPPARVEVRIERQRITRTAPLRLRFTYSEPADGAFLKVIYQWGERRFHVVDVIPPAESLNVQMDTRPGGENCRFVVIYSNGLRGASAATGTFALKPIGPSLNILQPKSSTILLGQPLSLEGQVVDPERPGGARAQESLSWYVDEILVGRGPIAGMERLREGRHRVTLRYEPVEGAEVSTNITVRRGTATPANEWQEVNDWGNDHLMGN